MSDEILIRMSESLGRIEQKIDSHVEAFDKHVAMDMEAYKVIGNLKTDAAKQKGYIAAVGAICAGLVTVAGSVLDRVFFGHHG